MSILNSADKLITKPLKDLAKKMQRMLETKLWAKVLLGLFLGVVIGMLLGPEAGLVDSKLSTTITDWLALPGNLFLKLVKMIIIPLVFSSIILGIVSSGNLSFLKKIGPAIAIYVVITTSIAIVIGLCVGSLIRPGDYINSEALVQKENIHIQATSEVSEGESVENNIPERIIDILPENPLESLVSGEMLGVVIFTLIIGIALLSVDRKKVRTAVDVLEIVQESSMIIVRWAMELAPYAIFGLMAKLAAHIGISTLTGLGVYILTVLLGLFIMFIVYNLIILLFVRTSPIGFLKKIKHVILLAFSTSSSAAVMPLSMKVAEEELHVKPSISNFVIPVGATINMDGTALYQSVAVVFMAQVFGIELSLTSMLFIVLITVGSSIGTPSAPGVGIVILATVLESVGIPTSGIALILGVDRILDMSRTAINVTGDLTACSFFNKRYGHLVE